MGGCAGAVRVMHTKVVKISSMAKYEYLKGITKNGVKTKGKKKKEKIENCEMEVRRA